MKLAALLLLWSGSACCISAAAVTGPTGQTVHQMTDTERIKKLEEISLELSRQLMLQQLYVEEMARSEGDSGLKQIRLRTDGFKTYQTATYAQHSAASIHDHSNLERTPGMGELIAVLNGVEFRTRHNDYKLAMPATDKVYDHMVDIPFPPVPPSVLDKTTVAEQSAEMREYFLAWRDQNATHRDYRPYFTPVLCYLEGAWTLDKNIAEPFSSDRHHIEADSWFDLQEKVRYTSNTGDRLSSQNLAFLPTTIVNITDGYPVMAQWNYRILCHPLHRQVNLTHLHLVDDFGERMGWSLDMQHAPLSRMARYTVDEKGYTRSYNWNELDDMMYEIPGKDNYGVNLHDDSFGYTKLRMDGSGPLNVGHYHRRWKVGEHDAMGETVGYRGFADRNMFVAENTQPRIAPMRVHYCWTNATSNRQVCQDLEKRVSYAIPLELIFLTPLNTWNPYEIQYHGDYSKPAASVVTANQRNGGTSLEKAYNGTHSKAYYFTPVEFFSGAEVAPDPADTNRAATGVLDRHGNLRLLKESGIRIILPEINGVGTLRTRYPVFPLYAEGSPIWKEVEALKDFVMRMDHFRKFFEEIPQGLNVYSASPAHHG